MTSWDITWRTHVAQYTLLPMTAVCFGSAIASPFLWWWDIIPYGLSIIIPWMSMLVVCLWVMAFGEHVMPHQTYKKVRSGEWE
jgi:hypothetical protein